MPNLDFYATGEDQRTVLKMIFDRGLFRVFEADSEPDRELREFTAPEEVPAERFGTHLVLYVIGSGPEPYAHRIDLNPGALGNATFRYTCAGLGLIQLHFGCFYLERVLRWSHTNHGTGKRMPPEDAARWDWAAVTRASRALNRAIGRMAIDKIGTRFPVLPQAAQLIAEAGLKYHHGTGIHTTPPRLPARP